MKNALILLLWLAFVAISLFATDIEAATPYQGTISFQAEHPYLNQGDTKWRLLLAPKSYLDSLNLNIQAGDTLSVTGWAEENQILVAQITNSQGQTFSLRNPETMANEYTDLSTFKVDNKQCIACRLCVNPCPTGAISIKAGKAYIDPSKCVECGICIEGRAKFKGCPVGAIK